LEPKFKPLVLGRRVTCHLTVGDRLSWEVIE